MSGAERRGDEVLGTLLARAGERFGDRPYLSFALDEAEITFAAAAESAARVAAGLAALGVGTGDRVLLMLRNRLEFVLGWLGAAMLGFGFSESIASWFSGTPVGDQFAALLGTFSLRPSGYLALAAQAVLIAAITAWASRRTLFATLDDIE